MLRVLALGLLLANIGYFVWSQGLLAHYGFSPATASESQRLGQQIHPEAMRLLIGEAPPALDSASAPATTLKPVAPAACLQAGLFTEKQADALRIDLQKNLPVGSWSLENSIEPARWIVYMGKYVNEEALARKRSELRQLNIAFEPLINPALGLGLSLGHFNLRADAERELAQTVSRGVRTAKVVMEQAEVRGQLLRLPAIDALTNTQLEALKPQLAGKTLQACRPLELFFP